MEISVLASGSRGNAIYIATDPGNALLVDAGIPFRSLKQRLGRLGRTPASIRKVLLTHEHTDHCQGLPVLLKEVPDAQVCATEDTARAVELGAGPSPLLCQVISPHAALGALGLEIRPLPLPHDAADPLGYLVSAPRRSLRIGILTDLGHAPEHLVATLADCHTLVLEFNHDALMLENSGRPRRLIRRIAGPRGHLSNDDAAAFLARIAGPATRRVFLAHLSRDCNTPQLAEAAARHALCAAGRTDVDIVVTSQDCETLLHVC